MSRIASPGENVSFAVTMGTIFSPVLGFDHFESLIGVRARRGRHYEIREGGEDEGNQRGAKEADGWKDVPDCGLHLVGIRSTDDEDLLHPSQRKALKSPIQKGGIAYGQQALERNKKQLITSFEEGRTLH